MQKIIYSIVLGAVLLLAGCNKFTDITPKGRNILNRVSDLDILLNYNFVNTSTLGFFKFDETTTLTDGYPYATSVPNILSTPTKSLNYALVAYDETVDRVTLAATDIKYEQLYSIINNVANIVLLNADNASGDRVKANQLKAEAYILRAYLHFLLINLYAKAYNPATAATDGGIPYVMDNDIATPNKKSTVAEVYADMLADIDAALQLNALPDNNINSMRVGKGFAYAVKAKVLLFMRNYKDAITAADASLAVNSTLDDYRRFLKAPLGTGVVSRTGPKAVENLFYAAYDQVAPALQSPTIETLADNFEAGNIIRDSTALMIANPISAVPGSKIWWTTPFGTNTAGLSTQDMYLVKAESLIRTQQVNAGIDVLNYLRQRRIYPYLPLVAATEAQAMGYLMKTARSEHLFTYQNFADLKRWNTEDAYKQTIKRTVGGKTYELKPESKLWIFPFPQSATNYNANLTQNY
jgi:hypothetical protein